MATVWSLQLRLAFADNSIQEITALKDRDADGLQFFGGTANDFRNSTALEELNQFLQDIGYGDITPGTPPDVNDYSFRFNAVTTSGVINVLGGSKDLSADSELITDNLVAVLADLNADPLFVDFMTNTASSTLLIENSKLISFSCPEATCRIVADPSLGDIFASVDLGDKVTVSGSTLNDGTFTVTDADPTVFVPGDQLGFLSGSIVPESAGASITLTVIPA